MNCRLACAALLLSTTACAALPVKPQSFARRECADTYATMEAGHSRQVSGGTMAWLGPLLAGAGLGQLALGGNESSALAGVVVGGGATVLAPILLAAGGTKVAKGKVAWKEQQCEGSP